mmetsp:Transcript_17651/g.35815  ORF Transcript_17651/g.35815 Transcript_17651/m.35815 type:complete len:128 (+) Transcript_17651:110-493(+)
MSCQSPFLFLPLVSSVVWWKCTLNEHVWIPFGGGIRKRLMHPDRQGVAFWLRACLIDRECLPACLPFTACLPALHSLAFIQSQQRFIRFPCRLESEFGIEYRKREAVAARRLSALQTPIEIMSAQVL